MKTTVNSAVNEIHGLVKNINALHASVNISSYQRDELEQYGRKESFRAVDVPEEPIKYDEEGEIIETEDCAAVAMEAAELLGITLKRKDIQRAHRVGRRRVPQVNKRTGLLETPKPRQIIIKLKDYGKRTDIVLNKKNLKTNAKNKCQKFEEAFIVEDLTPLRSKLLWYTKTNVMVNLKTAIHVRAG